MWGSSQALNPTIQGPTGTAGQVSSQLARINYGRPESWRFLFGLEILGMPQGVYTAQIQVAFTLIIGVGRSHFTIPEFVSFLLSGTPAQFAIGAGASTFWTSQAHTTSTFGVAPDLARNYDVDEFPAEDVQCSAKAIVIVGAGGAVVGQPVNLNVHSYFAPSTHVRPEWWSSAEGDEPRYRGAEQGGT